MSKKDGGPAFPHTLDMVSGGNERGGMTLRDYLAAKVLQGFCVQTDAMDPPHKWDMAQMAMDAYAIADAMLAERNK